MTTYYFCTERQKRMTAEKMSAMDSGSRFCSRAHCMRRSSRLRSRTGSRIDFPWIALIDPARFANWRSRQQTHQVLVEFVNQVTRLHELRGVGSEIRNGQTA